MPRETGFLKWFPAMLHGTVDMKSRSNILVGGLVALASISGFMVLLAFAGVRDGPVVVVAAVGWCVALAATVFLFVFWGIKNPEWLCSGAERIAHHRIDAALMGTNLTGPQEMKVLDAMNAPFTEATQRPALPFKQTESTLEEGKDDA